MSLISKIAVCYVQYALYRRSMAADIVEKSTSSVVINYGCALSRLRLADRRDS